MAQEVSTLTTQNSSSGGGFFGSLVSGLSNIVAAAVPAAADVYKLKVQSDTLSNQSAQQLETLKLQQQQLSGQAAGTASAAKMPTWLPYVLGFGVVILLVLVIIRNRAR